MAGHGGRRLGAGRKRGSAWKPVTQALRTAVRNKVISLVEADASPLEFLDNVIRDESIDLQTRMQACGLLLPYIAPRQSAVLVAHAAAPRHDAYELLATLESRLARLTSLAGPVIEAAPGRSEAAGGAP
ncbi:MAG: hypothetical protein ACREF3_18970 [Acetobacteraceae bacterium]